MDRRINWVILRLVLLITMEEMEAEEMQLIAGTAQWGSMPLFMPFSYAVPSQQTVRTVFRPADGPYW